MWSRKELKDRAKAVLRNIYWSAFGVSIVIALAGGSNGWGGGGGGNSRYSNTRDSFRSSLYDGGFIHWNLVWLILIAAAAILALRIFIGYSLEVGGRRYFIQSAQHRDNKNCFSFSFYEENYMGIVKTMLVKNIFLFLWTLLLIIPGIIKYYAYSMVPYILADNPNIGVKKAIALSNEMTMGHKFDMFVLDLSFIGWYFLGALALGLGVLFVFPYENATKAELYLILRKNALESSMCSYAELSLDNPYSRDNDHTW